MSKFAKLTAVAALVLGFTGLGAAQGSGIPSPTRSEVMAELHAARASGQMAGLHGEDSGSSWLGRQQEPGAAVVGSPAATAPVDMAALAVALIGEDSGSAYLSAHMPPSSLTRASVIAEVTAARASGELHAMVGEDSGAAFLARQRDWAAALYAGPNIGSPEQLTDRPAA